MSVVRHLVGLDQIFGFKFTTPIVDKVPCIANDGSLSSQICPTDIRLDPAYYAIYYTYMYTTFLAIGPLTLLILLNICVVFTVLTNRTPESDDSDTISLILVVFFFIFCNFTALLVNFMEIILNNPNILVYFVDLSNLLVVINGTANFFCYLTFGASFRHTLKKVTQFSNMCSKDTVSKWFSYRSYAVVGRKSQR
ncbi:unnamed protein product [Heligmosomoides polygyrus]|uniref:G_PROTEIN_RECEP_F1_2 domain-containing protein n=1 Tax=Heligmosomoides polygyrus TaxID=6339 RepID=A0A183GW49_HELPZ|nr:unnamed protein product [Heligmosomoides polygyrus]